MNPRDRDPVDLERSSRSVFVGNIPYEASEEQLKDIFSEVGPVLSFRLVFDRESGKPKGYGFAEYQDQETAMSAMRNLNNRELHGRTLRVDHATSEKNKILEDLNSVGGLGPPRESPFGDPVPPRDAPEAISKAVASLPPEQMFELMKQMKQCIQNNPVEARNMLLQNPQLAYALLQAQVVMRIVDPEIAMKMLHRQNPVQSLIPTGQGPSEPMDVRPNGGPPSAGNFGGVDPINDPMARHLGSGPGPMDIPRRRDASPGDRLEPRGPPDRGPLPHRMEPGRGPPDDRMDHIPDHIRGDPMGPGPRDRPMERNRGPAMGMNRGGEPSRRSPEPFGRGPYGRPEPREPGFPDRGPREGQRMGGPPMDGRRGPGGEGRGPGMMPPHGGDQRGSSLERGGPPQDRGSLERGAGDPRRIGGQRSVPLPPHSEAGPAGMPDLGNPDQEKAALIMQVLQLTPEQIAMLPEEQRKSILILKEQITGGRH